MIGRTLPAPGKHITPRQLCAPSAPALHLALLSLLPFFFPSGSRTPSSPHRTITTTTIIIIA